MQDVQFMTAREKQLVLKDWKRFLEGGFKPTLFTKRLYSHLHLHCGYIAHYSQQGFFAEYFQSGPDTIRFFEAFCQNSERFGSNPDYDDLNTAMRDIYEKLKPRIEAMVEQDVSNKLTLLETCLAQAKSDGQFAREFLRKINL